jgi:cobalt-zinc-cadmium efflux system protein
MAHVHAHDAGETATGNARKLLLALSLTGSFALIEFAGGWLANSLALISDAGHMVTDTAALALAAIAARVALRPADTRMTYGRGRIDVLAGLANGVFMLVLVVMIGLSAVQRLWQPASVAGGTVIVLGLLGLAINLVVLKVLHGGEQSLNLRGAMLHVIGDLLGSIGATVAGLVIWLTGWTPIDPLLSLLICGLIVLASVQLLREALNVLMEAVPRHLDLAEIGYAMAAAPGVQSVHDLHVWTLGAGHCALSAHIQIGQLEDWPGVLIGLQALLRERFGINHATLQPEPAALPLYRMPFPPATEGGTP